MSAPLFVLLALSTGPGLAVLPGAHEVDPRELGSLPVLGQAPQRLMRFHPGKQAQLARMPAWERFRATDGAGWQARFDQRTGLPYRAWGRGIDLGLDGSEGSAELEARLRRLLEAHPQLFGVDPRDLVLGSAGYIERTQTWFVRFDQVHDGLPVYRGSVEIRIRFGKLVMFGVKTYPALPTFDSVQLSEQTAREVAVELGPMPRAAHQAGDARLVVLPYHAGSGMDYALAWEVRSDTHAPRAKWVSWVDARSGELLAVQDELLRSERQLWATHDERTIDGNTVTSVVPGAPVWSDDGSAAYTDADGVVDLDGESFTSRLQGQHFRVYNNRGAEGELAFEGASATWTSAAADQGEIDSYIFLHHVRDWALEFAPENPISSYQLESYVNVNDAVCNAWFDGSFNFGPEDSGYGCSSTARIADVNYHEWGHGFHYWGLISGWFDSTASEAIADTCSFLQTRDATIAPYFWSGYSAGIRDVSELHVYPDDVVNESHEDGLILGGAIWDLLGIMMRDFGEEEGWRLTSQIFADAVPSGFTLTEAFDEFVVADDDDGDLGNGTPHYCQIVEAFTPHGLGPTGSTSLIGLSHVPVENQESDDQDYALEVGADEVSAECFDLGFVSGRVWYSLDEGESWDSADLTVLDGSVEGELPAQPTGSVVSYYIEVVTEDGGTAVVPSGGDINPFTFAVGEQVELYVEDFEADDGGYTHELLEGEAAEGADDWMWGTPIGAGGDPDFAYSGDMIWGNDLGGGNFNGQYQNEKLNQLSSPVIEVAPYNELLVQFRRWLHVEDGYYDQANVLVDEVLGWTNHASSRQVGDEHHQDAQWSLASVMADDPDLDGEITVSWQIDSDQGLYFAGWNIDDVAVYAPPTPRNLMTVVDFSASEGEPGLVLRWTNPSYEGLAELQVVYRLDGPASDHEDEAGRVVLHVDAPEPGSAATHTLTDAPSGPGYYTIFAADGEGTWTRGGYFGFNADLGNPEPWTGGDPDDDTGGDGLPAVGGPMCGCATSGSGAGVAGLWLGLLGLLGLRRRP